MLNKNEMLQNFGQKNSHKQLDCKIKKFPTYQWRGVIPQE